MDGHFAGRRVLVTGGAGFIGSHVVDRLIGDGAAVTVYDNLSTGREQFLAHHGGRPEFSLVKADVLDGEALNSAMAGQDYVFHFQANADVRGGVANTRVDLEQNTIATWNVLEAMRKNDVRGIAFSSTAVVYGEPDVFPTPEGYKAVQTSLYGASKLACEAMIEAYSEYFGITAHMFRFVSWIGERYTHGVIFDFMKKLRDDPRSLQILGDGRQRKSYLEVTDGIRGIFHAIGGSSERVNTFNIGHHDWLTVVEVADIVTAELGLEGVAYRMTGGTRGWVGDSPFVHLDTGRLRAIGWSPRVTIQDGIRATVRYLMKNPRLLERS